jgi:hypothetical protein
LSGHAGDFVGTTGFGRELSCMATARSPQEAVLHDAAGHAALLAVEALILTLIDRQVLSADDAIQAIDLCVATKRQIAEEGTHPQVSITAARLLSVLTNSLQGARPRLDRVAEQQSAEALAASPSGSGPVA